MTLQEKVQLVRQRLGDTPVSKPESSTALWTAVNSARLALYSIPTLLSLYLLYRISKNTKKAK